jgi:hypothetical protein
MTSIPSGGVQAEQGFRLKKRLDPEVAVFAADAGLLETAKRCHRLVGQRVDQHATGNNPIGHPSRAIRVARQDVRLQAVDRVVGDGYRLFLSA